MMGGGRGQCYVFVLAEVGPSGYDILVSDWSDL
jgi:hypothetical protein